MELDFEAHLCACPRRSAAKVTLVERVKSRDVLHYVTAGPCLPRTIEEIRDNERMSKEMIP